MQGVGVLEGGWGPSKARLGLLNAEGSYSAKGRISAFYDSPFLRTPLRTSVPTKTLTKLLLKHFL